MGANPVDFRFQQDNPLVQFGLGIGIKDFLRQQAGGIACGPGQKVIHQGDRIGRSALAVNRVKR